jgi:hypothetical protein
MIERMEAIPSGMRRGSIGLMVQSLEYPRDWSKLDYVDSENWYRAVEEPLMGEWPKLQKRRRFKIQMQPL